MLTKQTTGQAWKQIKGSITDVKGFTTAGAHCGLKKKTIRHWRDFLVTCQPMLLVYLR